MLCLSEVKLNTQVKNQKDTLILFYYYFFFPGGCNALREAEMHTAERPPHLRQPWKAVLKVGEMETALGSCKHTT